MGVFCRSRCVPRVRVREVLASTCCSAQHTGKGGQQPARLVAVAESSYGWVVTRTRSSVPAQQASFVTSSPTPRASKRRPFTMVSLQWSDRTFEEVLYQPQGVEPLLAQQQRGLLNMTMNPTK